MAFYFYRSHFARSEVNPFLHIAPLWRHCTCRGFTFTWPFESGYMIQSGPNTLSRASTRFINAVLTSGESLLSSFYPSLSLSFSCSIPKSISPACVHIVSSLSLPPPPSLSQGYQGFFRRFSTASSRQRRELEVSYIAFFDQLCF